MSGRLFIGKTRRPDVTKVTSDRIYYGAPDVEAEGDELAPYPGVALKGCSKDGKDGKDGSDGKEACDGVRMRLSFDDMLSTRVVDLDVRYKPRMARAQPPARQVFGNTHDNP